MITSHSMNGRLEIVTGVEFSCMAAMQGDISPTSPFTKAT